MLAHSVIPALYVFQAGIFIYSRPPEIAGISQYLVFYKNIPTNIYG